MSLTPPGNASWGGVACKRAPIGSYATPQAEVLVDVRKGGLRGR